MTAARTAAPASTGEALRGRHILILGSSSWDASMQRMQHFAHGLAEANRVVFVDPFNPGPYVACKVWLRRLLGKDSPLCHDAARPVSDSLHVYYHRARVLPLRPRFMTEETRRSTEERFLLARLNRYLRRIRFSPEVLCCTHPQHLTVARRLGRRVLVYYDVHDNMPAFFPEPERTRLTALDQALTRSAGLLVASSGPLRDRCVAFGRPPEAVHLVPNGVRLDLFERPASAETRERVSALLPPGRPLIGYVGTIAWWFDFDSVAGAADAHPEWQFVLVGPVVETTQGVWNSREVPRRPNLHYLGERPYEEVPEFIRRFDVCLIPFRMNELTRSVNPVKMYEYFALGKPVVSAPLPEVLAHQRLCVVAGEGPQELAGGIARALAEAENPAFKEQLAAERMEVARANTWTARVSAVSQLLARALAERSARR